MQRQDLLSSRLDRLEVELVDKISKLETHVDGLEKDKIDLEKRIKQLESATPIKRTARSVVLSNTTAAAAADDDEKYVGRSCQDLKFKDPSRLSGWYPIDPDGDGEGEPPIFVYCDMNGAG